MFWVTTARTMPRRSSSATAWWAGLGSTAASMSMRGRWKLQKRSGSARKVLIEATSIGSNFSQRPPAERKSGMPLSVEMPAPVSTTAYSEAARAAARSSAPCDRCIRPGRLTCPACEPTDAAPASSARWRSSRLRGDRPRQRPDLGGPHARDLHRVGRGDRPALDARPRPRLGHGRVRDAPRLDGRAEAARRLQGPARRAHDRDPAPHRAVAAGRRQPSRPSGSARSGWTATCCRPTAAPAAPRSAARGSRCTRRSRGWWRAAGSPSCRCATRSPRSAWAWSTACPCSTSTTREDSRAESDMNVVMTGSRRLVEVQATAEGHTFSRAELDVLLDLAEAGVPRAHRGAARRRGAGGRDGVRVVLATGNRDKVAELEPLLAGRGGERGARGLRPRRDRHDAPAERLDQGRRPAARGARRRARGGRRLGADGPRAGRPARRLQLPLRRARTRPTPTTACACWRSSTGWRTAAPRSSACWWGWARTTGCSCRRGLPGRDRPRHARAPWASATTRCSSRRARTARWPR